MEEAPAPAPEPEEPPAPELAPFPFTPEQIQAAFVEGLVVEWKVVDGDGEKREIWRVVTADEQGMTLSGGVAPVGEEPPMTEGTSTWVELRDHASFPAANTTVTEDVEVTTDLGTYQCREYKVVNGPVTSTFWFAYDLAGPPLRFSMESGGQVQMSQEQAVREVRAEG